MNTNRRNLLKIIGCSPIFVHYPSIGQSNARNYSLASEKEGKYIELLASYRKQWIKLENILPSDYISNINKSNLSKLTNQEIITEDFIKGNILSINGLVLSKFEAAHIAELVNCI